MKSQLFDYFQGLAENMSFLFFQDHVRNILNLSKHESFYHSLKFKYEFYHFYFDHIDLIKSFSALKDNAAQREISWRKCFDFSFAPNLNL